MMQTLEEARASAPWYAEDGDWRDESGKLVCGECGLYKEALAEAGDGRTLVEPVLHRHQLGRPEEDEAQRAARVAGNRRACFSGEFSELAACTFESAADPDGWAFSQAEAFCSNFRGTRRSGEGLILHGPCGRGKTFLAACVCNRLLDAGFRCLFTSTRRIRSQVESRYGSAEAMLSALRRNDLVVLDDLFRDRDTEWGRELVFDVVDSLYASRVPVVVTTNVSKAALACPSPRDQPVVDRLKERCHAVEMSGPNRRQVTMP